ncbi:MAG TPA: CRISPR-associated helicase Cas3' [Opitutaceae bacterium]|nr:CRISPR-associated helicase Cas3' [Opitutaceae bacterium]
MTYYAHTADDTAWKPDRDQSRWQLLADHLRNVAELAAVFAAPFGAADEARLAGLLHDLGKYQDAFQHYLIHGRPRTPHAIHGAAMLSVFRHLANLIASHHAGLHDESDDFTSALNSLTATSHGKALLQSLLAAYRADGLPNPSKPAATPIPPHGDAAEDLRLRLLLSALCDADYLDTEAHFLRAANKTRPAQAHASVSKLLAALDAHLAGFAARPDPSSLNQLRTRIAARCAKVGRTSAPGTFSLTVPTGGGKTLASAAFALHHAAARDFSRVIYVIPYTSIIEQNARVFASIFGPENVLEHHSLADWQTAAETENDPDGPAARARLAAENWDAPFIVTTNVQFFESLHSHRPSAVRKLHRLLGAVVLFDECQTFPPELLDPSLATLQALQAYGKTSIVFCTATQPAFERREFFPSGFPAITEIIPATPDWRLHERTEFRRTRIHHNPTPISLTDFAQRLAACNRALAIVNTRRTARELFDAVQAITPGAHVYHLSTFMCPAHRQEVFDAIRILLASPSTPCLVIATQLIEAGVDLDFPKVFRVLGPLDAILQAAGRCNREGRLTDAAGQLVPGEVDVVTLADAHLPPGIYGRATALAAKFLPSGDGGEISPASIRAYFRELYHDTERDKHHIAHLRAQRLHRQIGLKYRWIEEDLPTESVLTEFDNASRAWIGILESQDYQPPSRQQRRAIARLSINLRASDVQRGERAGIIRKLHCGLYVTQRGYDARFGYNPAGVLSGEHTIF